MNLRNGKLKNSAQPIPKRRYNKKMVVAASVGGGQDPPQGSGSGAANSTSSQGTQNTTGPNGSRPADNSQAMPENTTGPLGTVPVSVSTTAPSSTSAEDVLFPLTNAANNSFGQGTNSGFEWRPNSMYGMPYPFGTDIRGARPVNASTNNATFSPNVSSVGRSARNTSFSTQIPNFTTNNQATFRQEMDASNHDMVGVLARELTSVLSPLMTNIATTNRENVEIFQKISSQMNRMAEFMGVTPPKRKDKQPSNQEERPILERVQDIAPLSRTATRDVGPSRRTESIEGTPVINLEASNRRTVPFRQETEEERPRLRIVGRDEHPDEIVQRVRRENLATENNLTAMIERVMANNGLSTGLRRPNYTSPISDYIMQTELPRGTKVPKFTKFSGETNESTVEHIARYLTEAGDLAGNEDLRIKYFPSSLTKNAFIWFTTLPPNSIDAWAYLERLFHEQFYMGQTKISLKELASVKRKFAETIDDYLNRFRLLKSRCFTTVPEHELVEMAAGGLDYSIRKKLDTQYLRDMAQLADRVRQVERLKAEKARANKSYKKERVAYVEAENVDDESFNDSYSPEEVEINLAELKEAPPYACKLLNPANGKNPVENDKNDRFPKKTYTFDITKCDEIFDLLVKDGQMILPPNSKIPPLEQRKKRGFCKYHGFLGHKTSQCFLFRDLIQNAINDGRLKFADKTKSHMRVDTNPLNIADASLCEVEDINMVEVSEIEVAETKAMLNGKQATESLNDEIVFNTEIEEASQIEMTEAPKEESNEATEDLRIKLQKIQISEVAPAVVNMVSARHPTSEFGELETRLTRQNGGIKVPLRAESLKDYLWNCHERNGGKQWMCPRCSIMLNRRIEANFERARRERWEHPGREPNPLLQVYPRMDESLLGFLIRCHKGNSEVALCPRCGAAYDEMLARSFERVHCSMNQETQGLRPDLYGFDVWTPAKRPDSPHPRVRSVTFKIPADPPRDRWVQADARTNKWRSWDQGGRTAMAYRRQFQRPNRETYRLENYKGKNPMSRSQWRRHQRMKKAQKEYRPRETGETSSNHVPYQGTKSNKPPVERALFEAEKLLDEEDKIRSNSWNEEDRMTNDFDSDGVSSINLNCNVVSVLPHEFNQETEVEDCEEADIEEMAKHRPVCYYVLNNGAVEEQNAFFERPDEGMRNHLKPLYIRAKIENVGINKVLVDGGAAVNLMPQYMIKRIGMFDTDIRPHNMVLSNYEGKIGKTLGVVQVNLTVGSVTRPTMFMVIPAKANYNLLLGREWIHGVAAVPSTMHQRVTIWREDGIVENIEGDQSYYMAEVNQVNKSNFDRNLANIGPCHAAEEMYTPNKNALYYLTLHPNGFQWDREIMDGPTDTAPLEDHAAIRPTGWDDDINHV